MSKLSKHKQEGKHALKYDSIFLGKREEISEFEGSSIIPESNSGDIIVDESSDFYSNSENNPDYLRLKAVKEEVYKILLEKTDLDFDKNRRKPSKIDFNNYFSLLKDSLKGSSFSNIEIFNELAFYFSDNLFKMFKLLDNQWRDLIIEELENHVGKQTIDKTIQNKNIFEGTELEFIILDENDEEKHITGSVIQCDYEKSTYIVDSYENVYEVSIDSIVKILNNTKFKTNLNKLKYIDFL